ncbi:MAG: NAD-dependent deacylase [Rhodothermales bacterium]
MDRPARSFSQPLLDRLRRARRIAVLTGAGISAESGIATFRDPGGLWSRFRPEDLANVDAFLRKPDLVQRWYAERRRIAAEAEPNAGHRALVDLEAMTDDFTLITQNVDGLHRRAGSRNVLELHGNINRNYCIACRAPAPEGFADRLAEGAPADCPSCGGFIRPDVVWFGELLPADATEQAFAAARRADVVLSIGTSGVVFPAAQIPLTGRDHGAYAVEINIEPSAIAGYMDETLIGPAGTVLPELLSALREQAGEPVGE